MGIWRRRTMTTTAAAAALLAMSASSALAHHCYNDARSDKGNERAAASRALVPVPDFIDMIAGYYVDCVEGVAYMQEFAVEEGLAAKLVNTRGMMAGGAAYLSPNGYRGSGIGFLPFEVVEEAIAVCEGLGE